MQRLDDAVRRILRVKFRAGLFEHPYVDLAEAVDEASFLTADDRGGRARGGRPLDGAAEERRRHAAAGPGEEDRGHRPARRQPARHARPLVGPRAGRGRGHGLRRASRRQNPDTTFTAGCTIADTASRRTTPRPTSAARDAGFADGGRGRARRPTRSCSRSASPAERAARPPRAATSTCPGRQEELIDGDQGHRQAVRRRAVQRPAADARRRGRRTRRRSSRPGSPGVEAGNAVADVLFGKVNPGGKLPVSFPRGVGQVPIYYNHEPTGRPCDVDPKYNSRYRDLPTCDPLYAFGYGLSYTTFDDRRPDAGPHQSVAATGTRHGVGRRDQHRARSPATRSCSSTCTTRWPASPSRCAGCAGSSG